MKAIVIAILFGVLAAVAAGDYVPVPGGHFHSSCVHGVPSGSVITPKDDGSFLVERLDGQRTVLPACRFSPRMRRDREATLINQGSQAAPEGASGWQTYVMWGNNTDAINSYTGNWVVPMGPTTEGNQILYTFTALQNTAALEGAAPTVDIIQPVLQWGTTPAGGGKYWALASWYVTATGVAIHSNPINVNVSDTIYGIIQEEPAGSGNWLISSNDTTPATPTSTYITVNKGKITAKEPFTFVTLEVYNVNNCKEYPPATSTIDYTNLVITGKSLDTPAWEKGTNAGFCKEHVTIVSPAAITITF